MARDADGEGGRTEGGGERLREVVREATASRNLFATSFVVMATLSSLLTLMSVVSTATTRIPYGCRSS